jgi:diguanylate cyclase (GGDEF)-like protein
MEDSRLTAMVVAEFLLSNGYEVETVATGKEIERAKRAGSEFYLIMLDIDRFKSINDRFGHNAGDLVLKSMAELIKNRIRKIDTLARWGGEEFIILLLDTTVKNAACLAEELRESLSRMDIPGVGSVTASFGVACYCPEDTIDTLVNKADNMMYEAKAAGRNCVRYMNQCE